MDPTNRPETDAIGVGLVQGRHAPAATADLTDDADLAWDRFVPDEDEDDEDEDVVDALEDMEIEDSESIAEDLELRWDVFERDAGDAEDDAKSARFEAVLERMAQRAQRHAEGEALDDAVSEELLDDEELDDKQLGTDLAMLAEVDTADGWHGDDTMLGSTSRGGDAGIPAEDDRTSSAFARLEEAMYGTGENDHVSPEGLDEPYDWFGDDEVGAAVWVGDDADTELDDALRSEADSGPVHVEFSEPDAWLEDDDEMEDAGEVAAVAASLAATEEAMTAPAWTPAHGDDEYEEEPDEDADRLAPTEADSGGPATMASGWEDDNDWVDGWADPDAETGADPQWVDSPAETEALAVALGEATAWDELRVDEIDAAPSSTPLAEQGEHELHEGEANADADVNAGADADVNAGADADARVGLDDVLEGAPAEPSRQDRRRQRQAAAEQTDVRRVVLLACLFFAVVLGAVVLHFGHTNSNGSMPVGTVSSSPAQVARLQSAIADVQSASSGAQAELTTLTPFPTPPRVATIINPYVDSLHLYDTLAATVTVPARARGAAQAAETEVRADMTFLRTINGLPSIQLGAFISEFLARSTQLQQTMDTLQHALAPAAA